MLAARNAKATAIATLMAATVKGAAIEIEDEKSHGRMQVQCWILQRKQLEAGQGEEAP